MRSLPFVEVTSEYHGGDGRIPENHLWLAVIKIWVQELDGVYISDCGLSKAENGWRLQRKAAAEVLFLEDYFFDVIAPGANLSDGFALTLYRKMRKQAFQILDCSRFPSPTLSKGQDWTGLGAKMPTEGDAERGGE